MLFEVSTLLVCVFYLYHALQMPVGTMSDTGPGFFPVLLGVLGVTISATLLVAAISRRRSISGEKPKLLPSFDFGGNRDLILYVGTLVVFVLAFEALGGIIAIFLVAVTLARICGMKSWVGISVLGVLTTTALYVVFDTAFKISMPSGVLRMIW